MRTKETEEMLKEVPNGIKLQWEQRKMCACLYKFTKTRNRDGK